MANRDAGPGRRRRSTGPVGRAPRLHARGVAAAQRAVPRTWAVVRPGLGYGCRTGPRAGCPLQSCNACRRQTSEPYRSRIRASNRRPHDGVKSTRTHAPERAAVAQARGPAQFGRRAGSRSAADARALRSSCGARPTEPDASRAQLRDVHCNFALHALQVSMIERRQGPQDRSLQDRCVQVLPCYRTLDALEWQLRARCG